MIRLGWRARWPWPCLGKFLPTARRRNLLVSISMRRLNLTRVIILVTRSVMAPILWRALKLVTMNVRRFGCHRFGTKRFVLVWFTPSDMVSYRCCRTRLSTTVRLIVTIVVVKNGLIISDTNRLGRVLWDCLLVITIVRRKKLCRLVLGPCVRCCIRRKWNRSMVDRVGLRVTTRCAAR